MFGKGLMKIKIASGKYLSDDVNGRRENSMLQLTVFCHIRPPCIFLLLIVCL